ncbi:alpha/beta hydrolase [Kocuria himachalensis]
MVLTDETTSGSPPRFLPRGEGRLAFEVHGEGPLVVCVPGMGDLHRVYRFLAADLETAGYRVAVMDLRAHGDSDATFSRYDDVATGHDILALITHLSGPAGVVGHSMGAGAAVWAAARNPELVDRLVLIGPFVRDVPSPPVRRGLLRLALRRPWGRGVRRHYFPQFYPGRTPPGFDEHLAAIDAGLRRPRHWAAFVGTTRTTHAPAVARLGEVTAPTLVVMGENDPDFPDPAAEAALIAARLHGQVLLVPGAGHYPQAEYAPLVFPAVVTFLTAGRTGA